MVKVGPPSCLAAHAPSSPAQRPSPLLTGLRCVQVVNRVQKLRKKAGLAATDAVEVYLRCAGPPEEGLLQALHAQRDYVASALGMPLLPAADRPNSAVRTHTAGHTLQRSGGRLASSIGFWSADQSVSLLLLPGPKVRL